MTLKRNILFSAVVHSVIAFCVMLTIRSAPFQGRIFSVELEDSVVEHQAERPGMPESPRREIKTKNVPAVPQKEERKAVDHETKKEAAPAAKIPLEEKQQAETTEAGPAVLTEHSGSESRVPAVQSTSPTETSGDHFAVHVQEASGTPGQSTGAVSGGGQLGIIAQIRQSIEKAIIYPAVARKRRQEGTVVTEFFLNGRGFPEYVRVIRGSGFAPLDVAAQQAVNRAAPFPLLRGTIEVPITFRLEKNH